MKDGYGFFSRNNGDVLVLKSLQHLCVFIHNPPSQLQPVYFSIHDISLIYNFQIMYMNKPCTIIVGWFRFWHTKKNSIFINRFVYNKFANITRRILLVSWSENKISIEFNIARGTIISIEVVYEWVDVPNYLIHSPFAIKWFINLIPYFIFVQIQIPITNKFSQAQVHWIISLYLMSIIICS